MFLIRSLITNKLRPYQEAPIHQTVKEGDCFHVYGGFRPLVLHEHALNLSRDRPVLESICEDKDPFSLPWRDGLPGPAGRIRCGQDSWLRAENPGQLSWSPEEAGVS